MLGWDSILLCAHMDNYIYIHAHTRHIHRTRIIKEFIYLKMVYVIQQDKNVPFVIIYLLIKWSLLPTFLFSQQLLVMMRREGVGRSYTRHRCIHSVSWFLRYIYLLVTERMERFLLFLPCHLFYQILRFHFVGVNSFPRFTSLVVTSPGSFNEVWPSLLSSVLNCSAVLPEALS